MVIVLIGYRAVVFNGKTFDTSSFTYGVNGLAPPTGAARPTVRDFRVDPGASAWQMIPWAQVAHRQFLDGELPLWDPYQGVGTPLAGNGQSAVFDPLMAAVDVHPTTLVWDWTFLFAFMLGTIGMYFFLRNLGLSVLAAVVGAGAFVLSGFFVTSNNNSYIRAFTYLPLLTLFVDRTVISPRLGWVAGLAAATAGCILVGMPECAFLTLMTATTYGAYRLYRPPHGALRPLPMRAGTRLAAGLVIGVLVSAPLLVGLLGYLPASVNAHGTATGLRHQPLSAMASWVVPILNGVPFARDRSWLGGAGTLLLVVAIAAPAMMKRFSGWFFLVFGLVLFLKLHGVPVVQVLGELPVANRVDFPAFAGAVCSFCFAVPVAIGVEALAHGAVRTMRVVLGGGALGIVIVLTVALTRRSSGYEYGGYIVQYLLFAVCMAGAAVVLAAVAGPILWPGLRRWASPLAGAAVLLELLVLFGPGAYAPRVNPFLAPSWLQSVRQALRDNPETRVFGLHGPLFPDTSGVFGVQDIAIIDAVAPQRFVLYLRNFVAGYVDRFDGLSTSPTRIEDNPMFDLLGVGYVLTPATETVLDGSGQYVKIADTGGVSVYRNTHALPRAFVATSVRAVGTMAQAVSFLRNQGSPSAHGITTVSNFDPAVQAVVEGPPSAVAALTTAPVGTTRPARIVSYRPGKVTIDVPAGPPGLLVLTDEYFPGWTATSNGKPAPVLPTDVTFRGVVVGAAATRVVFTYHEVHEMLGWVLLAIGLLVLPTGWVIHRMWHQGRGFGRAGRAGIAPGPGRRPASPPGAPH